MAFAIPAQTFNSNTLVDSNIKINNSTRDNTGNYILMQEALETEDLLDDDVIILDSSNFAKRLDRIYANINKFK